MSAPFPTVEVFVGHEGDAFEVAGVDFALTLSSATSWGQPPGDARRRQPFTLGFRGPATPWLQQGTYLLSHPRVGALEIFLTPNGPDDEGMNYSAVFT